MLGQLSRRSIDLYHINLFGPLIFFYGDTMSLSGCKILHRKKYWHKYRKAWWIARVPLLCHERLS